MNWEYKNRTGEVEGATGLKSKISNIFRFLTSIRILVQEIQKPIIKFLDLCLIFTITDSHIINLLCWSLTWFTIETEYDDHNCGTYGAKALFGEDEIIFQLIFDIQNQAICTYQPDTWLSKHFKLKLQLNSTRELLISQHIT